MEGKRPLRHSNPSRHNLRNRKGKGKFLFFRKKNREVREMLKVVQ